MEIFPPIQCCLFIAVVSFTVQKLLHLIRSHLFILTFISFTLGENLKKKILLGLMSKSVLPMLSTSSFIVSSLTFRSVIQFILHMVLENVVILFFYM